MRVPQALQLPSGEVSTKLPRTIRLPEGEYYGASETASGVNGWWIVSAVTSCRGG